MPGSLHDDTERITLLLQDAAAGNAEAADALIPLVYDQLRRIAQQRIANEREGFTLQATELVHEALIKLAPSLEKRDWQDRTHFYNAAAEAMRRILVDHARSRNAIKRGGGAVEFVPINLIEVAAGDSEKILALNEAIVRLEEMDATLGQIVRLRFFAGLTVEETARTLGLSPRTVVREWGFARAWLFKELEG
jgi:RNA polymerase sigma factor (TIGR02999 family)